MEDYLLDVEKIRITKTILPELFELDTSPLLPGPIKFSWDELSKDLASMLKVKKIEIQSDIPTYTHKTSFEYPHYTLGFYVGTFPDPVFVLIGKEEVENLARHLLGIKDKEPIEEGYLEGFKDFLVGMAIHTIEKQLKSDGWVLKATDMKEMSGGPYLEYGVEAMIDESVPLDLMVALPKQFLEDWRTHYRQKGYSSFYREAVQSLIELTLTLEIGWVKLKKEHFDTIEVGDFIALDQLMWLPGKKRGRSFVSYKEHPLYLAAVKAEGIKIIEPTKYYEVGNGMAKEDEEFFDEEEEVEEVEEEVEEVEEEGEIMEEEAPTTATPAATPPPAAAPAPQAAPQTAQIEEQRAETFSLTEGELVIKVEIGRLKMTLDKLLKIEPGNILKLNTNLENGVNLIVNDKMIGRGELVSIGDLVGVRILNLGA